MPSEVSIGSIRQVHRRLRQEGLCIGEATLRLWVKDGRLPAVYAGGRALISYQNVLKILNVVSDESTVKTP